MKKIIDEFKTFIMRGNVLDMAIGVVMATAFGKITTSLVNDVIMPIVGKFTGGVDLSKLNICIQEAKYNELGEVISEPVNIGIGTFISTIIDFIIIAFIIFMVVKAINIASEKLIKKEEAEAKAEGPTEKELLANILEEIRKK
ncbi:MAG: large conductance mechanosensitive channel protein MscL [Lachnospiraceae bacterium]|nr:large conductance mechanosensitive channel protein MscL [Lachnospiraceae bacterium]